MRHDPFSDPMYDDFGSAPTAVAQRPQKQNPLMRTRARAVRTVTRIPELLYALTRQWGWIALSLCVAAAFSWYSIKKMVPIYEGNAVLTIKDGKLFDTIIDPRQRSGRPVSRIQVQQLLEEHVNELSSSKVLRKIIINTGQDQAQEKKKERNSLPDRIKQKIAQAKQKLSDELGFDRPISDEFGREKVVREAMESFQRRSMAAYDIPSQSVELTIFGADRKLIKKELETWIEAYNLQVDEDNRAKFIAFQQSRIGSYTQNYENAQKALEDFLKKNPDQAKFSPEYFTFQIESLSSEIDSLQQHLIIVTLTPISQPVAERSPRVVTHNRNGNVVVSTEPTDSAETAELRLQLKGYKDQLLKLKADGFQDTSNAVKTVNKQIAIYEQKLEEQIKADTLLAEQKLKEDEERLKQEAENAAKREAGEESEAEVVTPLGNTPEQKRQTQITQITQQIAALKSARNQLLLEKSKFLNTHGEKVVLLQKVKHTREELENMQREDQKISANLEQEMAVKVNITNPPLVGLDPIDYRPLRKLMIGCIAGIGIGLLLAIIFEALRTTMRFKHDITEEFDIPVVGVIPKR